MGIQTANSTPPNCGRRLLVDLVDELAQTDPERVLYWTPRTANVTDGFDPISSKVFKEAVDRASYWLQDHVGTSDSFQTIGYIGPNDLRYRILLIATVKTGHKLLLNSPRNSVDGHLNVIKSVQCNTWLVPTGVDIQPILEHHPMQTFSLPDTQEFLDGPPVPEYPYNKQFDSAKDDPIVVLHTSGSTSLPKPIILTNGNCAAMDAHSLMRRIDGKPPHTVEWSGLTIFVTFPIFHAGGLFLTLWAPLVFGYSIILPSPGLPNVEMVGQILQSTPCDAMVLLPSTLEEIAESPVLDQLKQIKFVSYGGGPLTPTAGNLLNTVTRVYNCIGATEAGWYATIATDPEDWQYFHFHPDNGFEMRLRPDGLYDHVIVRDPAAGMTQSVFETFPDLQEWPTQDMYEKHPSKPDHWLHRGRGDDIIVLSNGEKFNPLTIEADLAAHPLVRSALIFGHGRFQIGALLELAPVAGSDSVDAEQVLQEIWPTVERSNILSPGHAKLSRDLILIASADKPFLYASKSTVQRKPTLALYQAEIDHFYNLLDVKFSSNIQMLDTTSTDTVGAGIRNMLLNISNLDSVHDDADIFALGLDSLQILTLQRFLRAGLRDHEHVTIDRKLLYSNPTIAKMANAIYSMVNHETHEDESSTVTMQAMIRKYTEEWPQITGNVNHVETDEINVILTGSTGSLGSYLLDALMQDPKVCRIWCLNRSAYAEEKQTQTNRTRGLSINWSEKQVTFLHADLSQAQLGLNLSDYQMLTGNATHIIHNQWPVDFNLALTSFEPQIRGVRRLLDLAATSSHKISLLFVSSVSTAAHWPSKQSSIVPEEVIQDLSVAGMGYGESKLVSELILDWSAQAGVAHIVVSRVGQIAGPVKRGGKAGQWNRKEWFPAIIDTSARMAILPRTLGQMNRIDWVPVDFLADILLELGLQTRPTSSPPSMGSDVFHAVNGHQSSWDSILPVVKQRLEESSHPMGVVEWPVWVESLSRLSQEAEKQVHQVDPVAGMMLLDFFEGIGTAPKGGEDHRTQGIFDITHARDNSTTLARLDAVGERWMQVWMMQWGY